MPNRTSADIELASSIQVAGLYFSGIFATPGIAWRYLVKILVSRYRVLGANAGKEHAQNATTYLKIFNNLVRVLA